VRITHRASIVRPACLIVVVALTACAQCGDKDLASSGTSGGTSGTGGTPGTGGGPSGAGGGSGTSGGSSGTGGSSATAGGEDSSVSGGEDSSVSGGEDSSVSGGEDSSVSGGEDSSVSGGEDASVTCAPPRVMCPGGCVDLISDPANCGGCGYVCYSPNPVLCPARCIGGITCAEHPCPCPFENCDGLAQNGCEVNLSNDPRNCGVCELVCQSGICVDGVCR